MPSGLWKGIEAETEAEPSAGEDSVARGYCVLVAQDDGRQDREFRELLR